MDITRTAKGMASDKSAGLTFTLSSVLIKRHSYLLVALCYDAGVGAPAVKWGQRRLKLIKAKTANGITTRLVGMTYNGNSSRTRNIVATWTSTAPTAKTMFATMLKGVGVPDVQVSQAEAASADPDSGAPQMTTYADEICIGAFGSEGPVADTKGAIQNGYSDGQRVGTTGAPPASNVTIHEVYKVLTETESTAAAKTGATARNWCTVLVTFRSATLIKHGITPSDYARVAEYCEANNLDLADVVFFWNGDDDRWEFYTIDLSTGTLKLHQGNGWE